jgi:GNAT superfamily N-acetyltransferase
MPFSRERPVAWTTIVDPDYQRIGVATKLMGAVETAAVAQSVRSLNVQSSITAQLLYATWDFNIVREEFYGEERTIVMSKAVSGAPEDISARCCSQL